MKSLLAKVQTAGFKILAVDDGEESTGFRDMGKREALRAATEAATATDEAYVAVQDEKFGNKATLYIVLGNEPCELLTDFTVNATLEIVAQQHYDEWEGRACPKVKA